MLSWDHFKQFKLKQMETITLTKQELIDLFFKWNNEYQDIEDKLKPVIDRTVMCAEEQAKQFIIYLAEIQSPDTPEK